jgi:hypothetical protein
MNKQLNNGNLSKLLKEHKRTVLFIVLAIVLAAVILSSKQISFWQKDAAMDVAPIEKSEIFICYSKNTGKLEKKTLEAKKGIPENEVANIIIRELKKEQSIPEKTSLYDFASDRDGTIYLNLSKDILGEKADSSREIITVYSIVNSFLLSFKDSNRVQLLVEGQPVYTLNGTAYTYKPIEYNKSLMED